ncbi:SDR family NAD(P)-dependent oxidoreductase [Salinarimonas ramus]|uniref:Oxidoreductase n=1 Tax=Salinarimonas ramus TaxID=690164 RepID=A0A917Q7S1_9HYPH|nr:SDR family oxidoreductase [Salinarimonas ramus]GGK28919.1 oxidoreductase [Salinarimonas ramus]
MDAAPTHRTVPNGRLSGRHALVTGGGRGIGLSIARTLAQAGARVTVLGRDMAALERAVAAGSAHHAVTADVTIEDAIVHAFGEAVEQAGPIDLLVCNAGAAESAPFLSSNDELLERMLDMNYRSVIYAARAVLPAMIERGFGRIVTVASTASLRGYPYVTSYVAAKHATLGLVRALALETAKKGITVNAVCPGFTDTDLVSQSVERIMAKTGRSEADAMAELTKHNPQGRLVKPEEVADAVAWLCGEGAASVTGQAIAVAGGEV